MFRYSAWLVPGCGLLLAAGALLGANEDSYDVAAFQRLNAVLQQEMREPTDRREALRPTLRQNPRAAAPHWQAGFIEQDGRWKSFDVPPEETLASLLEEYRNRRETARPTVQGLLSLAHWCRQHGLKDQTRAHCLSALAIADDQDKATIYPRLGYRRVGNQWLSPQELADWKHAVNDAEAARREWGPRLERIARMFEGSSKQRVNARAELNAITDPRAAPAIEQALGNRSLDCASAAVAALASIPGYQCSLSLAQLAIFSEWRPVREAATAALRDRKKEDFVPGLIGLLGTPISSQFGIAQDRRGILFYTYVWAQETNNRINVRSANVLNFLVNDALDGEVSLPNGFASGEFDRNIVGRRQGDVQRALLDQLHNQERSKALRNDWIEEINGRVANTLATVSEQPRTTDPQKWWAWWAVYGDMKQGDIKLVDEDDEYDIVGLPATGQRLYVPAPLSAGHSCFQAGTPVWTETGMVPIDQIRIGDRVLAQDAATGELAYKPVLHKSLGPPRQLIRVAAGNEKLVCTDGHRFWVAGQAWIKARELTPKTLLHTATASVPVVSVSEGPQDETHNLVVADFHSYFVGKQAFLVQDLPLPRSTNCVVPGLQPEW
jgi:hypothetical protein